jgi:hypothetical protein
LRVTDPAGTQAEQLGSPAPEQSIEDPLVTLPEPCPAVVTDSAAGPGPDLVKEFAVKVLAPMVM